MSVEDTQYAWRAYLLKLEYLFMNIRLQLTLNNPQPVKYCMNRSVSWSHLCALAIPSKSTRHNGPVLHYLMGGGETLLLGRISGCSRTMSNRHGEVMSLGVYHLYKQNMHFRQNSFFKSRKSLWLRFKIQNVIQLNTRSLFLNGGTLLLTLTRLLSFTQIRTFICSV